MSTRWYPVFKKGNPQLRIFLPNFWMKLVRPEHGQPKNIVQFVTPTEMSDHDIREYLEKIYKVGVVEIRSEICEGELKRQKTKGYIIKDDDYRRAFVTLEKGEKFEFPDLFAERQQKEDSEAKKIQKQMKENFSDFNEKNKDRPGVPGWFNF